MSVTLSMHSFRIIFALLLGYSTCLIVWFCPWTHASCLWIFAWHYGSFSFFMRLFIVAGSASLSPSPVPLAYLFPPPFSNLMDPVDNKTSDQNENSTPPFVPSHPPPNEGTLPVHSDSSSYANSVRFGSANPPPLVSPPPPPSVTQLPHSDLATDESLLSGSLPARVPSYMEELIALCLLAKLWGKSCLWL